MKAWLTFACRSARPGAPSHARGQGRRPHLRHAVEHRGQGSGLALAEFGEPGVTSSHQQACAFVVVWP